MCGTVNSLNSALSKAAFIFGIIGCVSLTACENSPTKSHCIYDQTESDVQIIEIKQDPGDSNKMLVLLDFSASKLALETQELGNLKEVYIDASFVERNHLKVGNIYSAVVSTIAQGDCMPQVVAFNHALE